MTEIVSVGLIVYSHEKFIQEAVCNKTYRPVELFINEDASTDTSRSSLVFHAVGKGERYVH